MNLILKNNKPDLWLFIIICAYFVMNGAQLWETAIMIPAWTEAPPASLIFFLEPYGLDFKVFWIVVHSVLGLLFIAALIFNWKTTRRYYMLFLLILHLAVRAWTLIYFVPEIIEFQNMPYSETVDPELVERASLWKNLNYLRVGFFTAVNLGLLALLRIRTGEGK